MTLFPHYFSDEVVLRMFHPAGGENSDASLAGSVVRNGIIIFHKAERASMAVLDGKARSAYQAYLHRPTVMPGSIIYADPRSRDVLADQRTAEHTLHGDQ